MTRNPKRGRLLASAPWLGAGFVLLCFCIGYGFIIYLSGGNTTEAKHQVSSKAIRGLEFGGRATPNGDNNHGAPEQPKKYSRQSTNEPTFDGLRLNADARFSSDSKDEKTEPEPPKERADKRQQHLKIIVELDGKIWVGLLHVDLAPNDQAQRLPPGDGGRLQQNSPNNQDR